MPWISVNILAHPNWFRPTRSLKLKCPGLQIVSHSPRKLCPAGKQRCHSCCAAPFGLAGFQTRSRKTTAWLEFDTFFWYLEHHLVEVWHMTQSWPNLFARFMISTCMGIPDRNWDHAKMDSHKRIHVDMGQIHQPTFNRCNTGKCRSGVPTGQLWTHTHSKHSLRL